MARQNNVQKGTVDPQGKIPRWEEKKRSFNFTQLPYYPTEIEIHVALPSGKITNWKEEASNTIKHVKEKIQAKEGIPSDQQLLVIYTEQGCKEITDDCILSDCGSDTHLFITILQLETDSMKINIDIQGTNITHTLPLDKIKPMDTVGDLKRRISSEWRDEVWKPHPFLIELTYKITSHEKYTILQDWHTLSYYNIQDGACLTCVHAYSSILVHVKMLIGYATTFDLHPLIDIKELKNKNYNQRGFPVEIQILIFSEKELQNGYSLCDYNIETESIIHLLLDLRGGVATVVFVKMITGKILTIHIPGTPTDILIEDLKNRIDENLKESIDEDMEKSMHQEDMVYRQRLTYNGKLLQDYQTFSYYNIKPEATCCLTISEGIDIFIKKISGKTIILNIYASETMEYMKTLIHTKIEILPDQQQLIFAGRVLNDEGKISDYHIQPNSIIHLISKEGETVQILFKTQAKRFFTITFKTHGLETIKDLKAKIQQEESIPPDQQKLIFNGKVLGNEYAFIYYDIHDNTTILLEDTSWVISRNEIFLDHEELVKTNTGYYAKAVYSGSMVHAKCLDKITADHLTKFWAERMEISIHCRHPNIVNFIGGVAEHPIIVITELMDRTLHAALINKTATSNHIYSISMDVAKALVYLHSIQPHPLIHGNVNTKKVLLKVSGSGWKAKLSYLGCVHIYDKNHNLVAPEVRIAGEESLKMDVYSFGMLLVEMVNRSDDFSHEDLRKWPQFKPIIENCINQNPNKRPSMREVIAQLE